MEIDECAKNGSQFIIVTHSPILLGIPNANIYSFDTGQIHLCDYEDTESYRITKMFVNDREAFLHRLLDGKSNENFSSWLIWWCYITVNIYLLAVKFSPKKWYNLGVKIDI